VEPYAPRPIAFHGVIGHEGWKLKLYTILYGSAPLREEAFAAGVGMALHALPSPAVIDGRPGVATLLAHQGKTGWYVVLAWWDQDNELPLRVFVHPAGEGSWRPAGERESVCVWDLEVLGFERDAWVRTVMSGQGTAGVPAYLDTFCGARAQKPWRPNAARG